MPGLGVPGLLVAPGGMFDERPGAGSSWSSVAVSIPGAPVDDAGRCVVERGRPWLSLPAWPGWAGCRVSPTLPGLPPCPGCRLVA